MKTISYSSMKTFSECPLRYKFNYIDRIRVPYKTNIYGAFGSAVHLCIETFYNQGKFERSDLLDLWSGSFHKEMSKPSVEKTSEKELTRLFNQGYPILQKFYSTQERQGLLKKPIATELAFNIPCKNKHGDNVILIGKIDNVFKTDDGFEIVDYKTTASKIQWNDTRVTLQLVIYYIAFTMMRKIYKTIPRKVCLHFLRPGIKTYFNITKHDQIKALKSINKHLFDVRHSNFQATPSKESCKYCQYTHLCNANQIKEKGIIKGALFPYQQVDVGKCIEKKTILNANDVGLGKTVEMIYTAEYLRKHNKIKNVLIVCPNNLKFQWRDEIYKFIKNPEITCIDGSKRDRAILYQQNTFWNIISYDLLQRDDQYIERQWDAVVLDEASAFKNWKTDISKSIKKLNINKKTNYKFILTATPIENNLSEIYNMIRFLDFRVLGKFSSFQYNYIGKRDFFNRICEYKNIQQFIQKIQPILIRNRIDDVHKDIPKHIIKNLYLDFLPKQEKLYNATVKNLQVYLEKKIYAKKKDKVIDAFALSKFTYLREICNSTELVSDSKYSAKLEKLKLILKDINPNKVIIFSEFSSMVKILKRELGNSAMTITGKDSAKEKYGKIKKFEQSKSTNILLATDVIKYGSNLQFAHYLINFDLPFTYAAFTQRIGRERRIGQKYNVIVINLLMKNSCEDRIMDILRYKKKLGEIMDGAKFDTIEIPKSDGVTNKTLNKLIKQRG